MSDDFDLRLRRELRALADAVPTGPTVRPVATVAGHSSDALAGPQPVMARVRVRHGSPIGWSAAALALVVAIVAGAALFGGWRNGRPGVSAMPMASPSGSTTTALAGLTIVQPQVLLTFGSDDLTSVVLGPDGAAYVLDGTTETVYRVDLQTGAKLPIVVAGTAPINGESIVGNPRLLATGGSDVLVLDDFNSLWRWRPAQGDKTGRGSLVKVKIPGNTSWGNGTRAVGTFVVNPVLGQYNLYVVVPSASQILKYQPALDGGSYPTEAGSNYLSVGQDLTQVDDMYVDGKIYLVDGGKITQYELGQPVSGWSPADPGGQTPYFTRLVADNPAQDQGTFYAFDRANKRIVAFSKQSGAFVAQYAAPAGSPSFSALTGMFVTTGTGGTNPTLYWTEGGSLMSASLSSTSTPPSAVPSGVSASPAPTGSPTPLASSGSSAPLASPTTSTATPAAVSSNPGHWMKVTASMTIDGAGPVTRLADGRVLILDGTTARAELYDPKSGTFSPTGSMRADSPAETATLLHDGRVLVTGFSVKVIVTDGWYYAPLVSAEIYNPSTGTFSATGSMATARFGAAATLLVDGRVLFAGGGDGTNTFASAEIYDPATGTFSQTGSMLNPRFGLAATLLQDGRVLITGGVDHSSATLVAELYDPQAGKFSATGSMVFAAASQTATLLQVGRVLIAGGGDEGDTITARAQLYDPASGIFTSTGPMSAAREIFTATRLADGRVLVVGGNDGNGTLLASAELFDPTTGRFSNAASMSAGRYGQSATLLNDGRVLVTGGGPASAELYQP